MNETDRSSCLGQPEEEGFFFLILGSKIAKLSDFRGLKMFYALLSEITHMYGHFKPL
jgi:hypothetical protein